MKLKAVRWRTNEFLLGCYWQFPDSNNNNDDNNNNNNNNNTSTLLQS